MQYPEANVADGTPESLLKLVEGRHYSITQVIRYFAWSHLSADLQPFAREIAVSALTLVHHIPDSPQLTLGLHKLLEAKDCMVRAALPL